ncbi:hypothetical protein C2G38_2028438 [Gigaspora rosea]|uniref:Uncharacterized protein n=1 Tax=Gigaspora rosea TaxID=44941 RepID=A0A397W389_9GLOM|nr:hypothetical protein C2G38_2028438 [Gigaspora rosea]
MGRKGFKDNDEVFNVQEETSDAVIGTDATDDQGRLIDEIHDVKIVDDKEIALVLYKNDYTYCWIPVQNLRNADVLLQAHRKQIQDWNKREVIRTSQEKNVDQGIQEPGLNNENLTKDPIVNNPHQSSESPEIGSSNQSIDKNEKSKGKKRARDDDESQDVTKRRVGRPKKSAMTKKVKVKRPVGRPKKTLTPREALLKDKPKERAGRKKKKSSDTESDPWEAPKAHSEEEFLDDENEDDDDYIVQETIISSSSNFDHVPSPDRIISADKSANEDSDGYDLWDVPATPEPLRDVLSGKSTNAEDVHTEIEYSDDGHENDHDPWTMWNHDPDPLENIPEPTPSEKKSVKKSSTSANTLQPMADLFSDLSVSTETTYTQSTAFTPTKSNTSYLDESKQQVEMKKEDDYWKYNESHPLQDYQDHKTTYPHDYKKKDERQHDLIINASAPLSSSNEPFDTSPTTPQFNKRRQDSFGSSREGMPSTAYPLYTSPYHQYPSHNSLSQYGIYGSRASDYSSSQQSICSSQIISSSSAGRNSNDDDMNIQKMIKTESFEEQLSTYWTGSLVKGQLTQYIGRVVVKPLKDRCDNVDLITTIMSQPQLWMRNMIPQPYAERLVDPKDSAKYPIFLMDFVDDGNDNARKSIETDLLGMKWNEIVGVIWLNDGSNLCWLVFPNSQRTSTQLRIVPRPIEKFIIIPKTIYIDENMPFGYVESIKQSDPQTVAITQNPIIQDRLSDDLYYATQVSILSNNYYALPELCRNNPCFGVFGSKEKFEVREIIEAVKFFGGLHDPEFKRPDLNLILIHVNYLNQVNFIPRLIDLKHKPDCKFHIFGCDLYSPDPVNLVECFPSGVIVTITPQVFLSGRYSDIIQRVMDVCTKQFNLKWTIKLYSGIGTMLDAMCNENYEYTQNTYFTYASQRFKTHLECKRFELFSDEEIKCIEKLQKQEPPMVKILYYIMTRIHNLNLTAFRHVILIQDDTEVELGVVDVPGVERMLLTDFESIFGCSDSM